MASWRWSGWWMYHPRDTRLLVAGDRVVGFSYEGNGYSVGGKRARRRGGKETRRE